MAKKYVADNLEMVNVVDEFSIDGTLGDDSDTAIPTEKAIKAYVDAAVAATKQAMHPVGSIYTNASVATNPATLLGFGTWTAFGAGRVMVGLDSVDGDFDAVEETGGSKTHTLSEAELPSHDHNTSVYATAGGGLNFAQASGGSAGGVNTGSAGSDQAHNNVQPYIVVYMWKRTA